ncbi:MULTISPECIES: DUF2510 domain-containing protein [unclassified Streptomyces]|uniref:DUF2510 domain-containing protein n=1 Tax=unclassified Streptomyces TaxID=2593676 RepID=UPI002E1A16F2|nr:DUF2510 domain-containing protein [Streptomyces sp. NBC_01023]
MTHTTPPGWYPDTGLTATERWWDGAAWTAHTRPLDAVPQQSGPAPQGTGGFGPPQPGTHPVPHGFGPPPAPVPAVRRGPGGLPRAVPIAVGAVAAAALAVTVVVAVVNSGGDSGTAPAPAATGAPASRPATAAGKHGSKAGAPPADDPSLLVDELNGITLPVPDGWEKPTSTVDDVTTMETSHSYECPGDSASFCYHGRVTSRTADETELPSAEAVAKADIKDAADSSYDRDLVGDLNYDGITSHTRLESRSVTVAGRTGYLVRWRVRTGAGPGGYVQTVAFPSPLGSESMVVVRLAFDAGPDGPPLGGMDTITSGIRPVGDATSGGVGSSIGH